MLLGQVLRGRAADRARGGRGLPAGGPSCAAADCSWSLAAGAVAARPGRRARLRPDHRLGPGRVAQPGRRRAGPGRRGRRPGADGPAHRRRRGLRILPREPSRGAGWRQYAVLGRRAGARGLIEVAVYTRAGRPLLPGAGRPGRPARGRSGPATASNTPATATRSDVDWQVLPGDGPAAVGRPRAGRDDDGGAGHRGRGRRAAAADRVQTATLATDAALISAFGAGESCNGPARPARCCIVPVTEPATEPASDAAADQEGDAGQAEQDDTRTAPLSRNSWRISSRKSLTSRPGRSPWPRCPRPIAAADAAVDHVGLGLQRHAADPQRLRHGQPAVEPAVRLLAAGLLGRAGGRGGRRAASRVHVVDLAAACP